MLSHKLPFDGQVACTYSFRLSDAYGCIGRCQTKRQMPSMFRSLRAFGMNLELRFDELIVLVQ